MSGSSELARRLNALVKRETCADIGREIGLGAAMRLGPGEAQSGGRDKDAILGDICEAIIGAVFLDAGPEAAERLVRAAFGNRMASPGRDLQDAKTTLQEWAQGRRLPAPTYRVSSREGPDHAPFFDVAVEVEGFPAVQGTGASKRAAEQAAAQAFIAREGINRNKGGAA